MSKDPAFLFYPGDWLGGTMGMTIEQKGAYFELLIFQFNNGRFSKAQAEQVLSICFASVWQVVSKKFNNEGELYWNARLEEEVSKRKRFSESRKKNATGHKIKQNPVKAYAQHMEDENENEDWIIWGKTILEKSDQFWEAMKGRPITQAEMDEFLSVATRNKWKMKTQQAFRTTLKGFKANNNGSGKEAKNRAKLH